MQKREEMKSVVITCKKCGNLEEICYCHCPYCGENCDCGFYDKKQVLSDIKILIPLENQLLLANKITKEKNQIIRPYDDYWRLEKWKFGRANFP